MRPFPTVRIDGKAYLNQFGHAAAWEQVAANEWVVTYAQNGRTVGTERFSLGLVSDEEGLPAFEAIVAVSSDGRTLTETGQAGKIRRVWVFERK